MPSPYGVVATGFSLKTLAEILADLEAAEQVQFGAGIVLDGASPLGQWNGIGADAIAEVWELASAVYNAYDPYAAVDVRLDFLGSIRGVTRSTGESDADYRNRITNANSGNIRTRQLEDSIYAVSGVTWVNVIENATAITDANGLPAHSIAIAVVGGTDSDVALAIWNSTTAGIGLAGNTLVTVSPSGYCYTVEFIRPVDTPIKVAVDISLAVDMCNCSTTAASEIASALATRLSDGCRLFNGMTITPQTIRNALREVTGVTVECVKFAHVGNAVSSSPLTFDINELPSITADNVSVTYVAADTGCGV